MIIKAPEPLTWTEKHSVFLAGSIEMGKAVNWQTRLENELQHKAAVLNPRRDDWDASWVQEKLNPKFFQQVTWELTAMRLATTIAMYFDPPTQSPISLLELGLHAQSNKLIVCCPPGFWRRGNVEIVCEQYQVPFVNTVEELIQRVLGRIDP